MDTTTKKKSPAQRFQQKRYRAEMRAAGGFIPEMVQHDPRKLYNAKRYGMLDTDYACNFQPFSPRAWTRKELRNRIRWLQGEVSRIMMGKPLRGHVEKRKGNPLLEQRCREEALKKRRDQIRMYLTILDKRSNELDRVAKDARNARLRQRRKVAKREKVKEVWAKIKAGWKAEGLA
jgi:hypothetical protein